MCPCIPACRPQCSERASLRAARLFHSRRVRDLPRASRLREVGSPPRGAKAVQRSAASAVRACGALDRFRPLESRFPSVLRGPVLSAPASSLPHRLRAGRRVSWVRVRRVAGGGRPRRLGAAADGAHRRRRARTRARCACTHHTHAHT
eukprot:6208501-Pleurochrysis_carterae.AAC.1